MRNSRPDEGAEMFNAIGIKAIITCPLAKDRRLRAMMAVHQSTPRDWKPAEIALVEEVVERCWAIIERARADAVLRVSETLKSAIFDTSLDGFILMNHEGRILDWNNASEQIFGLKRDEVIGRMLGETILPERLREEHMRDLARYSSQRGETPSGRSLRAARPAQRWHGVSLRDFHQPYSRHRAAVVRPVRPRHYRAGSKQRKNCATAAEAAETASLRNR